VTVTPPHHTTAAATTTVPPASEVIAVNSDQPPLDTSQLPPGLVRLLHWAQTAERTTRGPGRRAAFRFTREVIGGATAAGYLSGLIAECLGVTTTSASSRMQSDGWLAAAKVEEGAGLDPGTLERWYEQKALTQRHVQATAVLYPAAEVARALAILGPSDSPASPSREGHTRR
jgi:hypothetical protein